MPVCRNGHHADWVWTKDRTKKKGGAWRCPECRKNAFRTRDRRVSLNKTLAEKTRWVGPRQLINRCAEAIVSGAEIMATINDSLDEIASGRLRYRPSVEVTEAEAEAVRQKIVDDIWEAVNRMSKADQKKPWNYLRVSAEAATPWEKFNKQLNAAVDGDGPNPNCVGKPELFVDYPEDRLPSRQMAAMLCAGCPLIQACRSYAKADRPAHGVWGGQVWFEGKVK